MTLLDAIIQSLSRAGEYNRDDQVAPAVILWPDKERQWEPVLPVLRVNGSVLDNGICGWDVRIVEGRGAQA